MSPLAVIGSLESGWLAAWRMMTTLDALLGQLFRLHHTELVRFASRLIGDRDCGEEAAQEAYLRIAARREATAIVHPKTYLFTAARRTAIDISVRRQAEADRRADLDEATHVVDSPHFAEQDRRNRRLFQLIVALNELPAACRQTFVLNKLHGMKHKDIARKLGISVSMVEKHMMRAFAHCRDVARDRDDI